MDQVTNYDQVKQEIVTALEGIRDKPARDECPLIYHLDVAAMYPNIILTNRLQPSSVTTDEVGLCHNPVHSLFLVGVLLRMIYLVMHIQICAACDFNRPDKTCLRKMEWKWRGQTYSVNRNEYLSLRNQLEQERFRDEVRTQQHPLRLVLDKALLTSADPAFLFAWPKQNGELRYYHELSQAQQREKLILRVKKYGQTAYKRTLNKPVEEERQAGICMRENPFYVDTVRR